MPRNVLYEFEQGNEWSPALIEIGGGVYSLCSWSESVEMSADDLIAFANWVVSNAALFYQDGPVLQED